MIGKNDEEGPLPMMQGILPQVIPVSASHWAKENGTSLLDCQCVSCVKTYVG